MVLLSMLPATSAFAASAPVVTKVTLSSEQGTVAVGNTVSFTATATQSGSGTPMYQFWYQGVHGNWHGSNWTGSNSFSLPALQKGSYEVVVFAKDKGQTVPANSESTNSNQFVNVDSSSTLTAPSLTNVAPGTVLNFTASSNNLTNPVYQLWIQRPDGSWYASGNYQSSPNFQVTAGAAGNYHAVLYAKDLNAPQTAKFSEYSKAAFDSYGQAAAVKLSAASSSLIADGKATDTITATVVDSNGNVVKNYNGQITVADSIGSTGASGYGLIDSSGNYESANSGVTYAVKNGQVQFKIGASSNASDVQKLTTSDLTNAPSGVNINYGSTSVSQTTAKPTQLALSASPSSLTVNTSNDVNSDPAMVTVKTEDSAGNTIANNSYVTLTLSGPGSFSPSSSQTSTTIYVNGSTQVPVYGLKGQPGTVSVSASASGLSGASESIPAYVNTSPAKITLTGTQKTTSTGTPYTLYTAQLLDTNGNPITYGTGSTDSLTISNSTLSTGKLNYLSYDASTGKVGSSIGTSSSSITGQTLKNGQFQFAVENTKVGTSTPTIKVDDTTENFKASAPYSYTVGSGSQVADLSNQPSVVYTKDGQSVTYSVQLEDSNGNPVTTAGKSVQFYFTHNGAGATLPNGISGTTSSNAYTATTNSSGIASVTVNVPSSGASSHSFALDAAMSGQATPVASPTYRVEPASNYATSMKFSGTTAPSTLTVGGSSNPFTGQTVDLLNAVNSAVTTSSNTLEVTTSNKSVVGLGNRKSTDVLTAGSSPVAMPSLTGKMAGNATVTVKDLSNPNVPSISETFTVNPGTASQGTFYVNGQPSTQSNELSVSKNTPTAVTFYNTDSNGNPVPVTSAEANGNSAGATFALPTVSGGGHFRATSGGSKITTATIPVGQESVTLYYVNGTASGSYYLPPATLTSSVTSISKSTAPSAGNLTASQNTGHKLTYTFLDANGNPIANQPVTFSSSGFGSKALFGSTSSVTHASASNVTSVTTNSSGQASIYVADPTAGDTGTISAKAGGATLTSGTQTIIPAALANYKVTKNSAGNIVVTAYDKYGNVQTSTTSAYVNYTATDGSSSDGSGDGLVPGTLVTSSTNTTINANGSTKAITLTKGTATLIYTPSTESGTADDDVTDTIVAQNASTSSGSTVTTAAPFVNKGL